MTSETSAYASIPTATDDKRIPVTLLTGFLGAGKTTLLNHLVHLPEMAGAAVLINEFGEIGIDHHLVDKVDETLMILDSGCLCCSVQGDLVKALKTLADRSSKREIPPVTRVLIETTGLADPVPVIYTLMQEWFISARYRCDGVITAVDATHATMQLEFHQEAVRQVVMADRLLITKCDLADIDTRLELNKKLDTLNPSAKRIIIDHGRIRPDALFGCGIYTSTGKTPDVAAWLGEEQIRDEQTRKAGKSAPPSWRGRPQRAQSHGQKVARHDDSVKSFIVEFDTPTPWYEFAVGMGKILTTYGSRLLRVKGLMDIVGDPLPRVIHCVQDVAYPPINLAKWPAQSAFTDHRGRLVFIARDLAPEEIEDIRRGLANLSNKDAVEIKNSPCPVPTICWLSHNIPSSKSPDIEVEGWNIQIKGLGKRKTYA
ncbi:GTP-binding protein [Dechloromonas sp. HYN0024]|uniref:CobW family GTP-binding protein n=1 Tax=Dechloromonas sp. HYN0024 TaxID=2231055 RepID=UPI000E450080|nr:GTP-binding protein [Dechloromonas sp. HYN0024]AXS79092.1 GTP-binding protein [Dechloromonas sp. HYN0024]